MKSKLLNPLAMPRALLALAIVGALLGTSTGALAAPGETSANTLISNTATLNYAVGGTAQGPITTAASTFVVDNKINLSLVESSGTFTSVAPGSSGQATAFTLTNSGNLAQAYVLSAANLSGTSVFGLADTFDVSSLLIYVDANGDGVLQPAELSAGPITSIASLARDTSIGLIVTATIPAGAVNASQAAISLTAVTRAVGDLTTALTQAANTQGGMENVFADQAVTVLNANGTIPVQAGRDATAIAYDAYRVAAAVLSVTKTATLVCDPFNGSTSPNNIPGATVQYAITITNASAAAAATLTQISDALQIANLAFDASLISGAGAGTNCSTAIASQSGTGFGAVRGSGIATSYVAPGPGTTAQAVTAGATFSTPNVNIDFATLAGAAYGAANAVLPADSFITVYFNTFVK